MYAFGPSSTEISTHSSIVKTWLRSTGGKRALYFFSAARNGVHSFSTGCLLAVERLYCLSAFLYELDMMKTGANKAAVSAGFGKLSSVCAMSLWLPRSSLLLRSSSRIVLRQRPLLLSHNFSSSFPRFEAKPTPPAVKQEPLGTRVWKKVKHEAQHYWHGSKLLVSEVRISSRLQWKILHGDTLTRRERRQVRLSSSFVVSC